MPEKTNSLLRRKARKHRSLVKKDRHNLKIALSREALESEVES